SPFLSQPPPACQMALPYASALPGQVAPGGEAPVAFRDYAGGGGGSNKWAYRSAYSPAYYEEVFHSRDFLQPPANRSSDAFLKSDPVGGTHTAPFHSAVGRNGVLPQGFDQFYEAARGCAPCPTEAEKESNQDLQPPPQSRRNAAEPKREKEREEADNNPSSVFQGITVALTVPEEDLGMRPLLSLPLLLCPFFLTISSTPPEITEKEIEKTPAVQNVEPHRPTSQNLVPESKDEREETQPRPYAIFHRKPLILRGEAGRMGRKDSSPFIIQSDIMSTKIQRFTKRLQGPKKKLLLLLYTKTTVYTANEIIMLGFVSQITSRTLPKRLGLPVMYQADYAYASKQFPVRWPSAANQW
uniref:DUF3528 domain-containing protein n=1 Tax=Pseudonaja textilis TaxID=8673 RepID=A0A670ZP55_PSETE